MANPTWNPIAKPGALRDYFKGNPEGRNPAEMLRDREPLPDHYMNPQARLKVVDAQGLQAVWLFPTLGVLYEELLRHDVDAVVAMMRGFNRWLHEDWGYNCAERIFGAPYIALGDPVAAAAEVDRVLGLGARILVMRPGRGNHPHRPALALPHDVRPGVAAHQRRRRDDGDPRLGLGLFLAGLRRRRVLLGPGWAAAWPGPPTFGPSPSSGPPRTG